MKNWYLVSNRIICFRFYYISSSIRTTRNLLNSENIKIVKIDVLFTFIYPFPFIRVGKSNLTLYYQGEELCYGGGGASSLLRRNSTVLRLRPCKLRYHVKAAMKRQRFHLAQRLEALKKALNVAALHRQWWRPYICETFLNGMQKINNHSINP